MVGGEGACTDGIAACWGCWWRVVASGRHDPRGVAADAWTDTTWCSVRCSGSSSRSIGTCSATRLVARRWLARRPWPYAWILARRSVARPIHSGKRRRCAVPVELEHVVDSGSSPCDPVRFPRAALRCCRHCRAIEPKGCCRSRRPVSSHCTNLVSVSSSWFDSKK
jgi:hypothetical protein